MGVISTVKRWTGMIFGIKAENEFEVKTVVSGEMERFVKDCGNIYHGSPDWTKLDGVKTVNYAQTICEEVARLATLAISIKANEPNSKQDEAPKGTRAAWIQGQIDDLYFKIREWVEYACAYGTIILKPNGESVDVVLPDNFIITKSTNGEVDAAVFVNKDRSNDGKKYYTRLEYHRFEGDLYVITNRCYVGDSETDLNKFIPIEDTPWNGLAEETYVQNLDKPLFAVLKTPSANTIDINSPMGMPIFAKAVEELKDLDIAYSRNATEIFESERIVLMDDDKLLPGRGATNNPVVQEITRRKMRLPRFVRNVSGGDSKDFYQEINPNLNTEERLKGLNALLSQIGFKCGFSNGYFVFNEKTGMITATQVEADDRRTIQMIKDVRDKLESALGALLYALDKFADLYELAPVGLFEVVYDMGDITYNREEDRARWWSYVQNGKVPAWMYFVKFEGMTEEEAKAMVDEAKPKEQGLFAE